MRVQRAVEELVAEDVPAVVGYLGLLARVAMILEAEYDGVVGGLEGALSDGLQHFLGAYLRNERVPVHYDRLLRAPIPKVQFYASVKRKTILCLETIDILFRLPLPNFNFSIKN